MQAKIFSTIYSTQWVKYLKFLKHLIVVKECSNKKNLDIILFAYSREVQYTHYECLLMIYQQGLFTVGWAMAHPIIPASEKKNVFLSKYYLVYKPRYCRFIHAFTYAMNYI